MKLVQLLESLPSFHGQAPDLEITGLEEDSRKVLPGYLFIAREGTRTSGAKFVQDAASRGAVAAVVANRSASSPIPEIVVEDPTAAVSQLAEAFYNHPSKSVAVIGVTGTNGKTTTTYLIRHLLKKAGLKCGVIGTVEIDDGTSVVEATMTTPSPIYVASLLARMRDNGCAACAIEVSSHALHQRRVGSITFAAGAFTNLTGDHIDYHGNMANYAAAKAMLFEMLPPSAAAIVNARDPESPRMVRDTKANVRRFGIEQPSDYRADAIAITPQGTTFTLNTPRGSAPVKMKLIGRHNIENALTAAACVAEVFGFSPQQIADGLADTEGAPGRLQVVDAGQPFVVLVDYAHTDDALVNVLTALRPLTRGKLRVLFGCGGDRDATKRPRMAAVAQKLADALYITSDNPRTEDPRTILDQIRAGLVLPTEKSIRIEPDRRAAIAMAIRDADPGDVVLLAGKGHENYQIIGTTKQHFDDVEEALKVLR